MNLLFIAAHSPWESVGGVERYLANLIAYAKETKRKVTLMLPSFEGKDYVEKHGSVTVYFETCLSYILSVEDRRQIEVCMEKSRVFSRHLKKIIAEREIEVICAENFHLDVPPAFCLQLNMIANIQAIPLALHIHSFALTELQSELVNQMAWEKVLCVSRSITGDCFMKGADIGKLETRYLGVDTGVFKSEKRGELKKRLGLSAKDKVVLIATRILCDHDNILQEKGIINTIRAFAKLVPSHPELRLVVATGKPPRYLAEEFEYAREKLLGYLKLYGVYDKTVVEVFAMEEMPMVHSGADVFVLPSENETFGQVFIEAMACETPVIGTKVGGIPEIIMDGWNGFLVMPNDATELSRRMETAVYDDAVRSRMVRAALDNVNERFSARGQLGGLLEVMEGLRTK